MKSNEIREAFIRFFESKGHAFVKSAPVVPDNDPTLLFTNAGMNQFKDVFLGRGERLFKRAVNSQICVRVSGKHNDLEDVGKDTTHHTSFEMLGNWSFGDYYKKEAIIWAWEFLTEVINLPKEKLYVTIFEEDDEAGELWKAHTNVNPQHIVKCGKKDNFWEMGEVGPCGPCSEIHFDLQADSTGNTPNHLLTEKDLGSSRFVELWNLVFMQFNREEDGSLTPLPAKHVDTGAGLERMVSVLQGKPSNYQTDLFTPIIERIEKITGVPYEDTINGMPHRVLADHCRTVTFGIADNCLPSNDGRGYVLRRLLRRALRYAQKLNFNKPIIVDLVDTVVDIMSPHFQHLAERKDYIKTVVKAEEESFLRTLDQGLALVDDLTKKLASQNRTEISGDDAFKLYDTYGFPVDLTQVLAEENNMTVDMDGFQAAMKERKESSRQATKARQKEQRLSGNVTIETEGETREEDLALLHISEYTDGIARGGEARILPDSKDKVLMAKNHTGTHVLHEALRRVLGDHVQQAGSLVDTHRLRFDFSHFEAITTEQMQQIQAICTDIISKAMPVTVEHMTLEGAKGCGARALFGEKYDSNDVRVVKIGDFSIELCGGTHVRNTALIEKLLVFSDSAIAAGTRRIEALAGNEAIAAYETEQKQGLIDKIVAKQNVINELGKALNQGQVYTVPSLVLSLEALRKLDEDMTLLQKALDKSLTQKKSKEAAGLADQLTVTEKNGKFYCVENVDGLDHAGLQSLADALISKHPNAVVVLASEQNGVGLFFVKCGKGSGLAANDILKSLTAIAGGKGGGNIERAQAGGVDVSKVDLALKQIY